MLILCWIGLGSNSAGVEFSGSASAISDHAYLVSDCGLPRGIKWTGTTYRSLGMQQMSMEVE